MVTSCSNHRGPQRGFTLVETVLALGIFAFCIVTLMGLFQVGLQVNRVSQDQIQAANLASLLISTRTASPTGAIANCAIPAAALTGTFGNAYPTSEPKYVGYDGLLTSISDAQYRVVCRAGTAAPNDPVSKLYLMLSWPPAADPSGGAARHYEIVTYIPLR